jgi:hypothetical protein
MVDQLAAARNYTIENRNLFLRNEEGKVLMVLLKVD